MNQQLLDRAAKILPDVPVLVNLVSKRVRQLSAGYRPLVPVAHAHVSFTDIALLEIIEGKIEGRDPGPPVALPALT